MTPELQERILQRLADTDAGDEVSYLTLAALDGPEALASYLKDGAAPAKPAVPPADAGLKREPPGVYVGAITVEGFRGIGPKAMLALDPGRG